MKNRIYLLDTNIVSYIIKGQMPAIRQHLDNVPMASICISAITEAELLRGLAKNPTAKHLHQMVEQFLLRVDVLVWDSDCAKTYADFRTQCEKLGKSLGAMDMLIAAHSLAVGATLISHDKAFYNVEHLLMLEDWTNEKGTA